MDNVSQKIGKSAVQEGFEKTGTAVSGLQRKASKPPRSLMRDALENLAIMLVANAAVQGFAMPQTSDLFVRDFVAVDIVIDRSSPAHIAADHVEHFVDQNQKYDDAEELGVPVGRPENSRAVDLVETSFQIVQLPEETFALSVAAVNAEWLNQLDEQLRARIEEADRRHGVLNERWVAPDLSDLAQEIIASHEEELTDHRREIPTAGGEPIIVQSASEFDLMEPVQVNDESFAASVGLAQGQTVRREVAQSSKSRTTSSSSFSSSRASTGAARSEGAIRVVAQSGYSTKNFPVSLESPSINWGFIADKAFRPVKDRSNLFEEETSAPGSAAVVTAEHEDHRPSLAIVRSSKTTPIKVYSESMIRSLLEMVVEDFDPSDIHSYSIVIGEVKTASGQLDGMRARLINDPEAKPVYFNEYFLPDESLDRTSENGIFVFVGRGEGAFLLEVEDDQIGVAPQLVWAQPGYVSYTELTESQLYPVKLNLNDFGATQNLEVYNVGLAEVTQTISSEKLSIDVPEESNFNFIDFSLEQGQLIRLMVDGDIAETQVPVFSPQVLEEIDQAVRLEAGHGVVAIYYEGGPFDLRADANGEEFSGEVLFVTEDGDVGIEPDESGFMVFTNVPPGLFEYALELDNGRAVSGIAVVEDSVITATSSFME